MFFPRFLRFTRSPSRSRAALRPAITALSCAVFTALFSNAPVMAGTITAASCDQATVQSAINFAVSGDIIILPAASTCSWASSVTIPGTKGITLDGNGATINGAIDLTQHATVTSRITNFNFTKTNAVNVSGTKTSAPFRVDHNNFTVTAGGSVLLNVSGNAPGLIDHNDFNAPTNSEMIHNLGMGPTDASGWTDDIVPGSAAAVYIEDNIFTNNGVSGNPAYFWGNSAVQSYYGARTVFRYNHLIMSHVDQHGTPGSIGARWWEIYENLFDTNVPNASQCCFIAVRAGSGVIFNNHHTGANLNGNSIDLYEEDTGYPALYQIGRGKNQALDPAYVWGNDAFFSIGSQTPTMVQAARDYFLSSKPGYTPYTYPHPLQGGTADTTPPVVLISAPTGGTTVSGTINVTASATDNVGVAGIQFKFDNVAIGNEVTAAPYTLAVDTTTTSNGNHVLTAVARDAAGNSTVSAGVTIVVNNATPPPGPAIIVAVSCTQPDVLAAVNAAKDGDTVMIPNGSCAWTSGITTTKQIWIRAQNYTPTPGGDVSRNVVITNNASVPLFDLTTGNNFHVALSGIRINEGTGTNNHLEVNGGGAKVALISDMLFEVKQRNGNAAEIAIIDWAAQGGVIWNTRFLGIGTGGPGGVGPDGGSFLVRGQPRVWNTASTMGALDTGGNVNIYVEDSSCLNIGQFPDLDDHGRMVFRHDNLDGCNGVTHGFTSSWGGRHIEYYDNVFSVTSGERNIAARYYWLRAGTALFTDNVVNNASNPSAYGSPTLLSIGDNTSPGTYPMPRQPGFGHNGTANVSDPIYIWNNTGARAATYGFANGWDSITQVNRDVFVNNGAKPGYAKYTYPHPARVALGESPSLDTTPPTVALTAPASGATASGSSVSVTATASDNTGVAGVQFKIDGANLGAEDTAAPYSVTLNTTTFSNGSHILTAVARDAAGNTATSAAVTVTVSNGSTGGPSVTASSCSQSAVQTAVNQAVDGGTVVVPAGSCSWSSPVKFSNSKGVSLMCATEGACTITVGSNQAVLLDTLSGVNAKLYRISGFVFRSTAAGFIIWYDGNGTMSNIRIDHNRFETATEAVAIFFGDTQGVANYYGVIDHNVMASAGSATFFQVIGATNNNPPPSQTGTANNIFVEDNNIAITTMTNAGKGCMDSWGNGAVVWRYNTTLNCLVTTHGVPHSGGPQNIELYNNNLKVDAGSVAAGVGDGYRLFHHQGSGEFLAFNNNFTAYSGKNGDPLEMTHYRSATPAAAGYDSSLGRCDGTSSIDGNRAPASTYFGYPCWRQPGRDFAGNLKPMYSWNNKWSDTGGKIDLLVANPWGATNPSVNDHLKAGRDYYNAVSINAQTSSTSPFNGSTGMGFGTLANRPATCTTNALELGGGVGYFATDQGPQGVLYRCAATNSWVEHYRPYTYPHPLTGGTATPADTTPPTVALTAPASGATVSGSSVSVTATASDNTGVAGVQFKIDGTNIGAEDTAAPYGATLDTSALTNGNHTLSAIARDAAGNTATSASVNVTVSNVTGGGGTIINAISCSQANVLSAINQAQNGDTVRVPAGNCAWSSVSIPNAKKITLQGAGSANTVITGMPSIGSSGSRITGFTFLNASTEIYGYGFRFDHNKVQSSAWTDCIKVRDYAPTISAMPWGLIDHNQFINCRVNMEGTPYIFADDNGRNQNFLWSLPLNFGSQNTVYIEDNTFELTHSGNFNAIDANYGGSFVARYNTVYDGLFLETHSSQEGGNRSAKSFEVYGNVIDLRNNLSQAGGMSERWRGGTGLHFFNRYIGSWGNPGIPLDNVRSYASASFGGGLCNGASTWDGNQNSSGWPCRDQIGRGPDNPAWILNPVGIHTQPSVPSYFWWNRNGSAEWAPYVISWSANHILANRDYYAYTTSFNGTSGVGVGSLAARPSTCAAGTAYWATNQSYADLTAFTGASHAQSVQGTLYRCTAPNTWTAYYTPLTYPHPLASGDELPPADTTPPTVALTAPASGATVSGSSVSVTATASDDVAVAGVQFKIDGANIGSEDTSSPYGATLDTSALTNGNHTLSAVARDAAGNTATSAITVNVSNGSTPLPSPLAVYNFDAGSGSVLADGSSNGYNGTLTNGPVWAAGKIGGALQFNATDNGNDDDDPRVTLGRNLDIPSLPFSFAVWINPANYDDWRAIFSKRDIPNAAGTRVDLGLEQGSGGVYLFTGSAINRFSYAPPVNVWTHLAVVATNAGTALYVNGALQENMGPVTLGDSANANVVIGGTGEPAGGDNDPFNGKIDALSIYTSALSAAHVQALYSAGITPDTTAPSAPASPAASVLSSTQINLTWTASTDNTGVAGYRVERCQGASCTNFAQIAAPTGTSYADTGLSASTAYRYRVRAADAANNLSAYSAIVSATTQATPSDTTPPSVALSAPAGGTVSGTISVTATASDNVAVAGVQFKLDGANLGAEDTSAPYSTSLDTTTLSNGNHTLAAVARDAAGNSATAATVTINVSNGAPPTSDNIIDPSRRIDWSQAGVPGGIPSRTTICATLNPGATSAQINSAIANCPAGQVVKLNAGTYTLTDGIDFNGKSNVTLRGAGPDQTFLVFTGASSCRGLWSSICVGSSVTSWSGGPSFTANWTGGYAKGATQITLSSTANIAVGSVLILDQLNDSADSGSVFVCESQACSTEGGNAGRPNRAQTQIVKVTAINGNTVTIKPGLYMPNWRASQSPGLWGSSSTIAMSGVEDMSVDHASAGGTGGIAIYSAYNCWVKNVRSLNGNRNHIWLYQAAASTVRDSYFYGTKNAASQSYGVETFISSDNLVENNIFNHITAPHTVNGSASGTVFAYNYSTDDFYSASPAWLMQSGIVHTAGTDHILFEGNIGAGLATDHIHGTHHFLTAFRNYYTGWEPNKDNNTYPVTLRTYSRFMNIVGNVLGTPGYHTNYENAAPNGVSVRSIFDLGWGYSPTSLPNDLVVKSTLLRWGNYDTVNNAARFVAGESPSGLSQYANPVPNTQTLPSSLYLAAKPAWWGAMPWPAIGPDITGGNIAGLGGHAYKVPAQLCYENTPKVGAILNFNANNCYGAPTSDTTAPTVALTAPTGGTVSGTISVTATASDNVAVAGVQFKLDGANLGAEDTSAPYSTSLDTTTLSNGNHTLAAVARDAAGNSATAASVTISVNNPVPDTTAPSAPTGLIAGVVSASQINLSWTASTDNIGVTGYRVERCQGSGCSNFVQIASPVGTSYNDAGLAASTLYRYRVRAADAAGNLSAYSSAASNTTQTPPDTTPPTILISAPTNGSTISGTVNITANATDNTGVAGVQFKFDGINIGSEDTVAPYSLTVDTTTTSNGNHLLTAVARDTSGNMTTSAAITITVDNPAPDTSAPSVPANLVALAVSATQINLAWSASTDNVGVTGYRLYRNGVEIGTSATNSAGVTGLTPDTTYSFTVAAYDAAGNVSAPSAPASAKTQSLPDTTAPSVPAGLIASVLSSSQINISWTASTDNVGVTGYQLERCQGSGCTNFVQIATPVGTSLSDIGLTPSTLYRYRVRAADAAGNLSAYSSAASNTTQAVPDTSAPSIAIATPANGATVTGAAVSVTASASDNVGVIGVQFKLDGVNMGGEDLIAPYGVTLNSTTIANGAHILTATARDAAGNVATSTQVAITVDNVTPDTASPSKPSSLIAATVSSSQINLSWAASTDNVGVVGYRLERCLGNGCKDYVLIASPAVNNHNDTGLDADTRYRYRVRAIDAAGNLSSYSSPASNKTAALTPSALAAEAASTTQINLTWEAPQDSEAVVSYKVERCRGSRCTDFAAVATMKMTQYNDKNLATKTHYRYRVRAIDAKGKASDPSRPTSAKTMNSAPVLNPVPARTIKVGETVTIKLSATDPDGDPIRFGAQGRPGNSSLNHNTGLFSWKPSKRQKGMTTILFKASDGRLSASQSAVITVQ